MSKLKRIRELTQAAKKPTMDTLFPPEPNVVTVAEKLPPKPAQQAQKQPKKPKQHNRPPIPPQPALPPHKRLADGSVFHAVYEASSETWSGYLAIPGVKQFNVMARALLTLTNKLDRLYRQHLQATDTPAIDVVEKVG